MPLHRQSSRRAEIGQRWPAPARCQQAPAGGRRGFCMAGRHRRLVVGGSAMDRFLRVADASSAAFAARCRRGRRSLGTGLRCGRDSAAAFAAGAIAAAHASDLRFAVGGHRHQRRFVDRRRRNAGRPRACVDAATRAETAGACRHRSDGDTVGAGAGVGVGVGVASAATGTGLAEWSAAGRRQAPRAGRRGASRSARRLSRRALRPLSFRRPCRTVAWAPAVGARAGPVRRRFAAAQRRKGGQGCRMTRAEPHPRRSAGGMARSRGG